jgi:hypothetical protein
MELAKTIALSAAGGMVFGLVGCGGGAKAADQPTGESTAAAAAADTAMAATDTAAKHCCKGQNDCSGKGNCKVEGVNECKGQNKCKGKGGCHAPDCTP